MTHPKGRERKGHKFSAADDGEPIHLWFELSYANYLAIPRSVLQSMPREWQRKFVLLMDELDETIDWRRSGVTISLRDEKGRYVHDDLVDYERGRRRIPHRGSLKSIL